MPNSLKETDAASQAVSVASRVSLDDIENAIAAIYHTTGDKAIETAPAMPELRLLSICLIVMKNGFTVIGKSAPASPENFNPDLGQRFAYEDAIRQIWPLMGFALRDRLSKEEAGKEKP